MSSLTYASRGSYGLTIRRGTTDPEDVTSLNLDPKTNICRTLKFSNNGQYLAYCDSSRTVVVETSTGSELFAVDKSKTQQIVFSPNDAVMVTYEPYVVYGTRMNDDGTLKVPPPNLNFWSLSAKCPTRERHLKQFTVKKQAAWRPQFTKDESKTIRLSDKGVFIYENLNFENGVNKEVKNLEAFAISPGIIPYMMCFTPSVKGQPALLQLRNLNDDMTVLYQMTSFNCDRCTMTWNNKGNAVLITATVEVDKSNSSYYGVSHLYLMTTKFVHYTVPLSVTKQGPLHYVEWSPLGDQFCVCYGYMPSKVTVYNIQAEAVWDLPEGHRNEVHYSPFGDILTTCGFGNISSGKMTFWNIETREEIIEHEAPMTTHFEWAPDGKHFLTATTAPRLRISNGVRIWNYATGVIYDNSIKNQELWQVTWKPTKVFQKSQIVALNESEKIAALANGLRGEFSKKLTPLENLPPGAISMSGRYVPPALRKGTPSNDIKRPVLSETDKKVKSLQKKLNDIARLKEKQLKGVTLELNQLEKIRGEAALRDELKQLRITA